MQEVQIGVNISSVHRRLLDVNYTHKRLLCSRITVYPVEMIQSEMVRVKNSQRVLCLYLYM